MNGDAHTLIGAYVLDAVTDLERAAFDRHMRDCEECRSEVDELREATARLADGAWSVPPPGLRDNVLAAIATTRQVAPVSPAAPAVVPAVVPAPSRSRLRLVSAAAAVVVAAGAAATAVYLIQDQRVRQEQANVTAARASENLTRAVLDSPDLVLKEQQLTTGGRVTVASSKLRNAGVVILAADAAPADGKVYQLWTIRGQAATPEGSMAPGQSSALQLVPDLPEADGVGVTVEPGPGATKPTEPLVGTVTLA
jgi:anti-sigma factor RsiW